MVEKLGTLAKKRVLHLWGKVGTFYCGGKYPHKAICIPIHPIYSSVEMKFFILIIPE